MKLVRQLLCLSSSMSMGSSFENHMDCLPAWSTLTGASRIIGLVWLFPAACSTATPIPNPGLSENTCMHAFTACVRG